jgi:hypothetical protein
MDQAKNFQNADAKKAPFFLYAKYFSKKNIPEKQPMQCDYGMTHRFLKDISY